jgi:hypothetical protein
LQLQKKRISIKIQITTSKQKQTHVFSGQERGAEEGFVADQLVPNSLFFLLLVDAVIFEANAEAAGLVLLSAVALVALVPLGTFLEDVVVVVVAVFVCFVLAMRLFICSVGRSKGVKS